MKIIAEKDKLSPITFKNFTVRLPGTQTLTKINKKKELSNLSIF